MNRALSAGRYATTVAQTTSTPSQIERARSFPAAAVDGPVAGRSPEDGGRGFDMDHPHLCGIMGRAASKSGCRARVAMAAFNLLHMEFCAYRFCPGAFLVESPPCIEIRRPGIGRDRSRMAAFLPASGPWQGRHAFPA